MDQNFLRTDLLPSTVPTGALWVMALAGVVIWVLVHQLIVRRRFTPLVRLGILMPVGVATSWAVMQVMGRHLFLAGSWHLLVVAALTGISLEGISFLYMHEASRLPKKSGGTLVFCRMLAILIVLFILLQPVLVGDKERTIRRRVVVLLDDSASMNFVDKYWTLPERLDVAAALGILDAGELSLLGLSRDLNGYVEKFNLYRQLAGADGADKKEVGATTESALKSMRAYAETMSALSDKIPEKEYFELKDNLKRVAQHIQVNILVSFEKLQEETKKDDGNLLAYIPSISAAIEQVALIADSIERAGYIASFSNLTEEEQAKVLAASDTTREAIVSQLLSEKGNRVSPLLEHYRETYDVDIYRFGSEAKCDESFSEVLAGEKKASAELSEEEQARETARTDAFQSSTDMTHAIELSMKEIPFEELAGILFLTDGRHNGSAGIDAVSRRLGSADIPICSVVVGGSNLPIDIAFGDIISPDSIFLGDKLRITGSVVATGATGKETKLRLKLGDEVIEEQTVFIENNDFAKEFRFLHVPESKGVLRYVVEVDTIENEEFLTNNSWTLDVSVTDNRTNVLLVDSRPRWEFRYLRNLFYGRDKSVHLQEYLVHPDLVKGQPNDPLPLASASRKFGDSESSGYPETIEEWRMFDVIILGDLPAEELPSEVVESIRYCVEERGALLVVIAGPNAMPHKIYNEKFQQMLPIVYTPSDQDYSLAPENEFNFKLTPSGRGHTVMQQSTSSYENESIWSELPEFRWRFPVEGIKSGAEVLSYAAPVTSDETSLAQLAVRDLQDDPDAVIRRLEEMRKKQEVNSLVVVQSYGQGKVVMLNTDRTWRFRYKVGDTRHHQFWRQVLQWGAGEKLRAGNTFVRLGTDKLRYTPSEKIKVFSRMVDENYNAMLDLKPSVVLSTEGQDVKEMRLEFREDSNGFYEAMMDPIADPGVYTLTLHAPRAKAQLGMEFPENLSTRFVVVTAEKPAEFVHITSSDEIPRKMAQISEGLVVGPAEIDRLRDVFGEGNRIMHERTEHYLWDSALLFILIIALLTTEWIIRKRKGIA